MSKNRVTQHGESASFFVSSLRGQRGRLLRGNRGSSGRYQGVEVARGLVNAALLTPVNA